MTRRFVETARKTYSIALDAPRCIGERQWSIVQARLVDELTQRPIVTPISVETDMGSLTQRAIIGGIAGLAGVPSKVFAFPDLAVNTHEFSATFKAQGYLPYTSEITMDPIPHFPDSFTPVELGDLGMHREPVVISGRVMKKNTLPVEPVAGVTVRIAIENDPDSPTHDPAKPSHECIWLRMPLATANQEPDKLWVRSLKPDLYFSRKAGTTQVRRRELIHQPTEDKYLLDHVVEGSRKIRCSDRENLAIRQIIAVDAGDVSINGGNLRLTEYVRIVDIDGAGKVDQPAVITLEHPLRYYHRQHAIIRRTDPQVNRANNELGVDAITGDSCILLNSSIHLDEGQTVEIADGDQPNEYRRIFPITTNTDADGYFRLPLLHRIAQLNLQVQAGPSTTEIINLIPDYSSREHCIDVMV